MELKEYEEQYEVVKKIAIKYWEIAESYAKELNWFYIGIGIFVILFGLFLLDSLSENRGQGKMLLVAGLGLAVIWVGTAVIFGGLFNSGGLNGN